MRSRFLCIAAAFLMACLLAAAPARAAEPAPFTAAELDQKLASIALFPDALLSQVLMASTYPSDVAQAVEWAYAHRQFEGDAAVQAVQDKPWDPSVQSLVAFPQVLAMLGENPQWVRDLGDAFLAQPGDVMDSVQFLRAKAKDAGNLASNEQQVITIEARAASAADCRGDRAAPADADHRHRPGQPAGRVRAHLQPALGVRPMVASGVSAVLLPAAAALGLGLEQRRPCRVLVGRGHRRVELAVGRCRLAPARRQHQRQPLEHHQRQSPHRLARPRRELAPQRRTIATACPIAVRQRAIGCSSRSATFAARDDYRGRELQRERARDELANRVGAQNLDRDALRDIDRSQLPQRPVAPIDGGNLRDRAAGVDRGQLPQRPVAPIDSGNVATAQPASTVASPEPRRQCRSARLRTAPIDRAQWPTAQPASTAGQSRTAPRMSIVRRCKAARPASTGRNCRIAMRAPPPSTETTRCATRAMRPRRASRSIAARQARLRCSSALRVPPAARLRGGNRRWDPSCYPKPCAFGGHGAARPGCWSQR